MQHVPRRGARATEHFGQSPDPPTCLQTHQCIPGIWDHQGFEKEANVSPACSFTLNHPGTPSPALPTHQLLPRCLFLPKQQVCSFGFLNNILEQKGQNWKTQTNGTYWSSAFRSSLHHSAICPSWVVENVYHPHCQGGEWATRCLSYLFMVTHIGFHKKRRLTGSQSSQADTQTVKHPVPSREGLTPT